MTTGWGVALRIARRTARQSIGRTILIAALIGLPVLAASWVAVMNAAATPTGERLARQQIGRADAAVTVTTRSKITVDQFMSSSTTVSYTEPPDTGAPRDPSRVDVGAVLPAGSVVVPGSDGWSTAVSLRTPNAVGNYLVQGVDASSPLTKGTYRLDAGRMPSAPGEVALSPALADHLRLLSDGRLIGGATVSTPDGHQYSAVGIARRPDSPEQPMLWAEPRTELVTAPKDSPLTYLVDLPDGTDVVALQGRLAEQGLALTPRAWIVDPPAQPYGGPGGSQDAAAWAVVTLVIGFGVLEIVLLAGTAFAVGARRQTRELGLITATGGRPTDVRRVVLAQGLFLGVLGTAVGAGLAIGVAVLGRPAWERLFDRLIDGWSIPVVPMLAVAGIGILAGLAAAVVPAISAGRQQPVAALSGRFVVAKGNDRVRRPALVLVGLGTASVLIGSVRLGAAFAENRREAAANPGTYAGGITPTGPIAMVLIGITAVIAGLVWLLPNLVARAASLGRALPLSGRLALRDAARHRHRTGPAAAAIMMSVGGTVAMAFALSNSFAAEKENYRPAAPDGWVAVYWDRGLNYPGAPRPAAYGSEQIRQLSRRLPVRAHHDIAQIEPRTAKAIAIQGGGSYVATLTIQAVADCQAEQNACYSTSLQLLAVDPDHLDRLGDFGPETARVLRAGRIAVPSSTQDQPGVADVVQGGQVSVSVDGPTDPTSPTGSTAATRVPAEVVTDLPRITTFGSSALVSPSTAARLGRLRVTETQFELTRPPTDDEMSAATKLVGDENAIKLERGYEGHAGVAFIALLSAATVVTLLGVAIAVALSAAEGRADLATLAAVGAPPRRRRALAAAQAWLLGQIGCVLGAFVGALYGYTAHVAFGSPSFAVPWRELGGILVAVPLFAGALAWLLTRSRLPMVRRVE